MPFNFQTGSMAAVIIYFLVVIAELVFSFLDTRIGEKKDREREAAEAAKTATLESEQM